MNDPDDVVPAPEATGPGDDVAVDLDDESPIEGMRHMPTGTNDPNIVGDVGPTDVPPGSDPHDPGALNLTAGESRES